MMKAPKRIWVSKFEYLRAEPKAPVKRKPLPKELLARVAAMRVWLDNSSRRKEYFDVVRELLRRAGG